MMILVEGYEFIDEFGVSITEKSREIGELKRGSSCCWKLFRDVQSPGQWVLLCRCGRWQGI